MNQQAIAQFVQVVAGFGPVRAKYLPRNGQWQRITKATVAVGETDIEVGSDNGTITIPLKDIEQIIFAAEDQKFFVHLIDGLVELRPDTD